jgi:alanine-synthesizing transaminase
MVYQKSAKLDNVCYDIRGPALDAAKRMEDMGHRILKLNIGNPATFGFDAPDEIVQDVIMNLRDAQGYSDSRGIFPARKAVMHYCQEKGIPGVGIEDIIIGNGVSEMIMMAMQALLNSGDEILIPAPDYPLWTAAVNLSGGTPVHYICDEQSGWYPDLADMKRKITAKTKGIVVINPNNPTGAVYPEDVLRQIVNLASEHQLIIFADEIYDKILYDDVQHTSLAALSDEVLFITMNGLSKAYRACGFRAGWMVISGNKRIADDYIAGLNMLSSMRLCSNVPAQYAIQTALGGYQSIKDLTKPGGRLREQRDFIYRRINEIPGLSCTKPQGAFYIFPKIDTRRFQISDDEQMVMDLLAEEKVLLVKGTGFNWPAPDHFRIVYLPECAVLEAALAGIERFLTGYQQESSSALKSTGTVIKNN